MHSRIHNIFIPATVKINREFIDGNVSILKPQNYILNNLKGGKYAISTSSR